MKMVAWEDRWLTSPISLKAWIKKKEKEINKMKITLCVMGKCILAFVTSPKKVCS